MKVSENTVLITGGGSGIGFEIAKRLSEMNNRVIITGRDKQKLETAAARLQNVVPFACDITSGREVEDLQKFISKHYEKLNMLVNNAGQARAYRLSVNAGAFEKASGEIMTNYLAVVRLTEALLPQLLRQPEAAVIMTGSIVSIAPASVLPTYSASKAALHSYTTSLRLTLAAASAHVKVFEVLPALVDTSFSGELPGEKIPASDVASALLEGLESDCYEIRVGLTEKFYQLFLQSPQTALALLNNINNPAV